MQLNELQQTMRLSETQQPTTEQQADEYQEQQTITPITQQPLDIQVTFLVGTVYKHITTIANLFDILRKTYPDLNYELGPILDKWLIELNDDIQQNFGFSILEGE